MSLNRFVSLIEYLITQNTIASLLKQWLLCFSKIKNKADGKKNMKTITNVTEITTLHPVAMEHYGMRITDDFTLSIVVQDGSVEVALKDVGAWALASDKDGFESEYSIIHNITTKELQRMADSMQDIWKRSHDIEDIKFIFLCFKVGAHPQERTVRW